MKSIPYGRQFIDKKDKISVTESLSKNLITTGSYVTKLENKLKKYFKCNYSYVCSSGTAAIHLAMLSLELKKNDIILMPAINFIASFNIAMIMKLKVYLVDVDEFTGQITPSKVEDCIKKNKLKKISALITMFHGGYPENVREFYEIKKKYNFYIIEDACHALGSAYKYKKNLFQVGSCRHSDICTFSLHPLKTITSGEGGVVTTNIRKIAKNILLFRSHGIIRNKKNYWQYDVLKNGYNYRLSDINCSLAESQLKKINFFLKKRKKIYTKYFNEFKNFNKMLSLPKYSPNIKSSFHLFLINISFNKINKSKDKFMKYLNSFQIFSQQHYIPIYKFSIYKKKKTSFPGSERYFANTISIPIFVDLDTKNQKRVIRVIKKFF